MRKLILSQKVSGIMENLLGLGQKTLREPLFLAKLGNTQKNIWLCRHAYQKVFGVRYTKIDSIKKFILNKPSSIAFRKHGLQNKKGNRTLGKKEAEKSINEFFTSLREEEVEAHASRARLEKHTLGIMMIILFYLRIGR